MSDIISFLVMLLYFVFITMSSVGVWIHDKEIIELTDRINELEDKNAKSI